MAGEIYAGLTHITKRNGDINCTTNPTGCTDYPAISVSQNIQDKKSTVSNNMIIIDGDHNVSGNISAGYTGLSVIVGNITAADTSTDANANAYVTAAIQSSGNTFDTNDNSISIIGNTVLKNGNLTAGYTGISVKTGNLTASEATATATASASVFSFDNISTNDNSISITGNTHLENGNLATGYAGISALYGDISAAAATATADADANSNARVEVSASSTFNSNQNTISIAGSTTLENGNISAGYSGISSLAGNIAAAEAYSNAVSDASAIAHTMSISSTLNSNHNTIEITGNTRLDNGNLTAGYAGLSAIYGDISSANATANSKGYAYTYTNVLTNAAFSIFNSNANTIEITGNTTLENGNLTAGYASASSVVENITTAETTATASMSSTAFSDAMLGYYNTGSSFNANENTIAIIGNTNLENGNLTAGYVGVSVTLGNLKAADATAYSDIYNSTSATINAYGIADLSTFDTNRNKIKLEGETTALNIYAGHVGVNFTYGDIQAGNTVQGNILGDSETTPGQALLNISFANSTIEASNNSIELKGQSTVSSTHLQTGRIDFNVQYGALKNGDGTEVNPFIYSNGIRPNYGLSYLDINGTAAFAINNTISLDGAITFGFVAQT